MLCMATEKEGLAVVSACKHFLPYLIGRRFTVTMDHLELNFLHNKDITSGCLVQWFDSLIELHFDISYHCVADNSTFQTSWAGRLYASDERGDVRPVLLHRPVLTRSSRQCTFIIVLFYQHAVACSVHSRVLVLLLWDRSSAINRKSISPLSFLVTLVFKKLTVETHSLSLSSFC